MVFFKIFTTKIRRNKKNIKPMRSSLNAIFYLICLIFLNFSDILRFFAEVVINKSFRVLRYGGKNAGYY